jgi:hypothetical protein
MTITPTRIIWTMQYPLIWVWGCYESMYFHRLIWL